MTIFQYRREPSAAFGIILRPVASLMLSTNAATLEVAMYIDSGADMTVIPFRLGRSLGFRRRPKERLLHLSGIGGAGVPYVMRTARIRIGENSFRIRLAWAFIEDLPLLLGRVDIFPRFQILFDERRRQVRFTPVRR